MSTLQHEFAELRHALSHATLSWFERTQLWELIQRAYATNSAAYLDQWLPYIQSFPHHLQHPACTINTVEALDAAATMLPHALWHFVAHETDQLYALMESEHAASVTELNVRGLELIGADLYNILEPQTFGQLTSLNLSHNPIDDEDMLAFEECPPQCLHTLLLDGLRISEQGLEHLLNVPDLSTLKRLSVHGPYLDVSDVELILDAPHIHLTQLSFNNEEGIAMAFVVSSGAASLTSLSLHGGGADMELVEQLVSSKHLQSLEAIDLYENSNW